MIRLIQRRLIIPRGDTGSFTIPVLSSFDNTDIAVFSIFNQLTRKKIFEKQITPENDLLNINFTHEETINLKPGKYVWDIKFYKNPEFNEDNELINGEEVNSYYAGFNLPVCEIKETAEDWPIDESYKTNEDIVKEVIAALPSAIGVKF